MAIQHRRGQYSDFDPSKMVNGEIAVVTNGDPNTINGKSIYMAFAPGNVKRIATIDDIQADFQSIIDALIDGTITNIQTQISNLDAEVNQRLALSAGDCTSIPANSNLNDYTTVGNYKITTLAIAKTITNIPSQLGGRLIVMSAASSGQVIQIYISTVSTGYRYFVRNAISGNFLDWVEFATTKTIADAIENFVLSSSNIPNGLITREKLDPNITFVDIDTTLSHTGEAADAAVVGTAIGELNTTLLDKIGYKYNTATSINNCDLDDVTTTGSYRVTSVANAKTITNIPAQQGGVLLVFNLQASALIWQRYIIPTGAKGPRIYDRNKTSNDVWCSWYGVTTTFDKERLLPINEDEYISLSAGDDLNNITTVGVYKSTSASITRTLLNKPPINIGFMLIVMNIVDSTSFLQIVKAASDGQVYLRYVNSSAAIYGEWKPLAYDDVDISNTITAIESTVANNTTRISVLESRSGIEGDYFTQFEEQEQALYDKVNNDIDKNTLVFVVSADNHYRETKPEGEHQVYHAEVMAKIAKRIRADAIINLGDIITQYIDSIDDEVYADTEITAEEVNTMRLAKMATAFQSTGVPFLYTLAHHEMSLHNNGPTSTDNTTQTSVYPYPESKVLGLCGKGAEWIEEHHYSQDPLSAGYYVDFARHKVRLIFIDSVSYSAVGFSPSSIAFITEAFSNVPSGYKVIVCSHAATRGPGVYSSTMKNWEPVENIMSNFVSNGGTILAILHGHAHYDNVVFIENVPYPYICICCAENSWSTVGEKIEAGVQGNPVSYKAHSATRGDAIGTYNEWLFDIMCVHPDTNTLKFFRFGIGEDRTVTLSTS